MQVLYLDHKKKTMICFIGSRDSNAASHSPGFTLHSGVLRARPDVNCALHMHTEAGMCIAAMKHGN